MEKIKLIFTFRKHKTDFKLIKYIGNTELQCQSSEMKQKMFKTG